VRLAYFGFAAANAYTQASLTGMKEAGAKMGAEVQFFDSKFDPTTQFNQIQDAAVSGRFDGFLISPNGTNVIVPAVTQAIEKGIKVASLEYPLGPDITNTTSLQVDGMTSFVGYNVVSVGQRVGEATVKACEGRNPCKVAVLMGSRQLPQDPPKLKAMREVFASHPEIEIVTVGDGGWLRDKGLEVTQNFLQAHPDLDVIASPSGDQMISGSEQAIKDAGGKLGGKEGIQLIGLGATKSAIAGIRDGRWFGTYASLPVDEGRIAAENVIKAVRGEEYEEIVDLEKLSPVGAVATKESLDAKPDWQSLWEG
jgi:ribose transport system substrate-binding protein